MVGPRGKAPWACGCEEIVAVKQKNPVIIDAVESVLKSWWILVAALSTAIAVFITVGERQPTSYEAAAVVRVSQAAEGTTTDAARHDLAAALSSLGSEVAMGELQIAEAEAPGTFEVRYRDRSADRAARLVNALVEGYVDSRENLDEDQTGVVEELASAVLELRSQSDAAARDLEHFRTEHGLHTGERRGRTTDLLATRRSELETLRAELTSLRRQRDEAARPVEPEPTQNTCGDPQVGRVAALRNELSGLEPGSAAARAAMNRLEGLLADYVPTLDELGRHVECLAQAPAPTPDSPDPTVLASLRREIDLLATSERRIVSEIRKGEAALSTMAGHEQELAQLAQAYESRGALYERRSAELSTARERMAVAAASRPMLVARASTAGSKATKRATIPLVVALIAGALFVGPVILREVVRPCIVSEAGLQAVSPVPVLVSIPQPRPPAVAHTNRRLMMNVGLAVCSVAASLALLLS